MEFWSLIFVQRSLIVGLLLAVVSSLMGVLVVLRRMAFLSDAISHASFTGIALGLVWGLSPTWGAVVFSVLIGLLIIWLSQKKVLQADAIIGVLFSGSVALGVLILSRVPAYKVRLVNFLFGDILAVSQADLYLAIGLCAVVLLVSVYFFRSLVFVSFSQELAQVKGLKVNLWNYLTAVLLSLTIALSIKIAGVILVSALIIIPATAAKLISRNVREMIFWSIIFGLFSVTLGMIGSYYINVPAGPAIVMIDVCLFALAWLIR